MPHKASKKSKKNIISLQQKTSKKKNETGSSQFLPDLNKLVFDKKMRKELMKMVSIVDEDTGKKAEVTDEDFDQVETVAKHLMQKPKQGFSFTNMVNSEGFLKQKLKQDDQDEDDGEENEGEVEQDVSESGEEEENNIELGENDSEEDVDGLELGSEEEAEDADEDGEEMVQQMDEDSEEDEERELSWQHFGLDNRILGAIKKLKYENPSLVQQKTIPKALLGKDLIAKAATGSGKTFAFGIPIIQHILETSNAVRDFKQKKQHGLEALIIAPTNELSEQICNEFAKLTTMCKDLCPTLYLGKFQSNLLDYKIIVGTPPQVLQYLKHFDTKHLKFLIIDEADMVLQSYFKEMQSILASQLTAAVMNHVQCMLMSATLEITNLPKLKSYLLKQNSVSIDCTASTDAASTTENVGQYYFPVETNSIISSPGLHKILLCHALIRYKLGLDSKVLIFVEDVKNAVVLYAGLKKLGIEKCVILSPDFPLLSRLDIMNKFNNSNEFNVLITLHSLDTVTSGLGSGKIKDSTIKEIVNKWFGKSNETIKEETMENFKQTQQIDETLFNMARGIDYKNVFAVINFDLPKSFDQYVHCIGRAGRGNKIGIALTLVDLSKEKKLWSEISSKSSIELYSEFHQESQVNKLVYRFEQVYTQAAKTADNTYRMLLQKEIQNALKLKKKQEVLHTVSTKRSGKDALLENLPAYLKKSDAKELDSVLQENLKNLKRKRVEEEEKEDEEDENEVENAIQERTYQLGHEVGVDSLKKKKRKVSSVKDPLTVLGEETAKQKVPLLRISKKQLNQSRKDARKKQHHTKVRHIEKALKKQETKLM